MNVAAIALIMWFAILIYSLSHGDDDDDDFSGGGGTIVVIDRRCRR